MKSAKHLHPNHPRRSRNDPRMSPPSSERGWPTEEAVYHEHRAALEATLLQLHAPVDELIFELEDGRLLLRPRRR